MRGNLKENWNKVDETCLSCGQVTKKVKGMTKQNLKRLLVPKFNSTEVLITIMIIMILVLAFAYKIETKTCKDWLSSMFQGDKKDCLTVCDYQCEVSYQEPVMNKNPLSELNLSNLNLTK
jgi:hypothetical protein